MTTKYYLKVKCDCSYDGRIVQSCVLCKGTGFTQGADVTELTERIIEVFKPYADKDMILELFKDLIEVVEEKELANCGDIV